MDSHGPGIGTEDTPDSCSPGGAERCEAGRRPTLRSRGEGIGTGDGREEPESGSIIVEALPDSLKECCLRVLVWPVHYDDGEIDERELCEI